VSPQAFRPGGTRIPADGVDVDTVLTGTHAILYADDADAARASFRDALGLPHVDAGGGWPVVRLPPPELGVHPVGEVGQPGRHELHPMCDDVEATAGELPAKGVESTSPTDQGLGLVATLRVPGAGEIGLYRPRHPPAYDL
jgi:catechol 2,3-dioxygenase-like lactoylglutathione lyase family enzyme